MPIETQDLLKHVREVTKGGLAVMAPTKRPVVTWKRVLERKGIQTAICSYGVSSEAGQVLSLTHQSCKVSGRKKCSFVKETDGPSGVLCV